MGAYVFKLPDIGEGIAESEIATWRVEVGDRISEDQPLVDMLTDKAAVEIPSPVTGKVIELHGAAGDKIAVGGRLVTIQLDSATIEVDETKPAATQSSANEVASRASAGEPASSRWVPDAVADSTPVPAAPSVRKLARERGIDLREVKASGPAGRVLRDDLDRHAGRLAASAQAAAEVLREPIAPMPAVQGDDGIEQIKLIGLRRKIAEAMQRAKQRIPHFAYVEEVDVTELEAMRARLNALYPDRPRLTLLPLLIQALGRAIADFPMINATYDDEAGVVSRHRALHAGIATQTPAGLVVPVMKDAQRLSLWQRAAELRRLADAARAGKATRAELSGSTLTITSLGALGGIVTTPVINAPEVAIIGVNKIAQKPVVIDGQVVVRSIMNLSSSFDHRIVDGFDAASFIQRVKALLEAPTLMFIEGA
ncbi:dihydrolipoamide acetyltransferase family protein [Hydrocarboniphaga effusa]|uniref:dihydrolipoamide acetyltransferase family protein n=1 Tax=Hydrocarboniphaga effusa TaxID=243629 RepID=UPI00398BE8D2